jgi:hypothetical protein
MNDPIETYELNGKVLKIYQDDCSREGPREWDNLGTMVCSPNKYDLGDKHDFDFGEWDCWKSSEEGIRKIYSMAQGKIAIMLPLYLYDHSGITMNTTGFSCAWDSSQVGWIFVTEKKLREEYDCNPTPDMELSELVSGNILKEVLDKARKRLVAEVEVYDTFLRGEVYGFILENSDGNVLDSCWGFYGQDMKKSGMLDYLGTEIKEELTVNHPLLKGRA